MIVSNLGFVAGGSGGNKRELEYDLHGLSSWSCQTNGGTSLHGWLRCLERRWRSIRVSTCTFRAAHSTQHDLLVPIILSEDSIALIYISMIIKVDTSIDHNKTSNQASWQSNGSNI